MTDEKEEKPKRLLYSVWLEPGEHEAANKLIDIFLEKKLVKKGPKGFVSRRILLLYLIYAAVYHFKDEILPENREVIKQNGEEIKTY